MDGRELIRVSQRENEGRGLIGTPDDRVLLQGKYVPFLLLHAYTEVQEMREETISEDLHSLVLVWMSKYTHNSEYLYGVPMAT